MKLEVIRSKRKTIAIQVCTDCHIRVRAPYGLTNAEINAFVKEKEKWIEKHIRMIQEKQEQEVPVEKMSLQEIQELADRALQVLPPKVQFYAGKIGVDYGRITIRNQKTRWGSCSGKGNLNFNCLLMLVPESVQDYVVIHELCHRKEMNHSQKFWAEVAKIMPDYQEKRKWLKEHGEGIMRRMLG